MCTWLVAPSLAAARVEPPPADADETPASDPDAVLGELVVMASDRPGNVLILPKLDVVAGNSDEMATRLHEVVTRDLGLCGEFNVTPVQPSSAADGMQAWRDAKVPFLVRVQAWPRPDRRIDFSVELVDTNTEAVLFESHRTAQARSVRDLGHEFTDRIIEAVTGDVGPFRSSITFVGDDGKKRRVHLIDPDGARLRAVSPANDVALSPAFGPGEELFYLASANRRPFRLYRSSDPTPIRIDLAGSIYGLDFSDDRTQAAVAVATGEGIHVFRGTAELAGWKKINRVPLALHPTFGPRDQLAYAGTRKKLQRVYVGTRPVSLPGLAASAPAFCRHPGGTRLVYSVGVRNRADIVASDPDGSNAIRLTRGRGRNSAPACSPDGRLVAFFSTRKRDEGPGLYVMRVDGHRPKKIANVMGHSLNWSNRFTAEVD